MFFLMWDFVSVVEDEKENGEKVKTENENCLDYFPFLFVVVRWFRII